MQKTLTAITLFIFLGPASQVAASETYFGSGLGKECFDVVSAGQSSHSDLKLCTKAIQSGTLVGGNLPATYVNRGILLMRMEQYGDAIDDYTRALELKPELAEAKINMGAALIGLRRYASAIDILTEGLREEPMRPHVAYYNLGIAHEMIGDYRTARTHYKSALDIAPEWSPALRKLEQMPLPNQSPTVNRLEDAS